MFFKVSKFRAGSKEIKWFASGLFSIPQVNREMERSGIGQSDQRESHVWPFPCWPCGIDSLSPLPSPISSVPECAGELVRISSQVLSQVFVKTRNCLHSFFFNSKTSNCGKNTTPQYLVFSGTPYSTPEQMPSSQEGYAIPPLQFPRESLRQFAYGLTSAFRSSPSPAKR